MYQHLFNKGSKFCSKVAVKDFQDCDSIIPLHFCLLFANYRYLQKNASLNLTKSFQRVGNKVTIYAIS